MTTDRSTILIFGAGVIGGNVADLLSRMDDRFQLVVAARNQEKVNERINLSVTVAINLGYEPIIEARQVDVTNRDQTSALIAEVQPDLIINATSLQTFWEISLLPKTIYQKLSKAKIGPWLPNHLATTRALMQSVSSSGSNAPVVNASFPDGVNPALATVGLAPLVGGGNVANLVPTLERASAEALAVSRDHLVLRFAAHHVACNAISSIGSPEEAPYALSIESNGEELAEEIDHKGLFDSVVGRFRRTRGVVGQIVASSGVAIVAAALLDADAMHRIHVPGPHGLAGGYPAFVGKGCVQVDCTGGFDLDQAMNVNTSGAVVEGIEDIQPDGTILFAEREMSVMTECFGYSCRQMHVHDVDEVAAELQSKYRAFAARYLS